MRPRNGPYRPEAPTVVELASGAVVVLRGSTPARLLVLRLADEQRWCLPKGHVEPGESLEAAARREVAEESGVDDLTLDGELCEVAYRFHATARRLNVVKVVVYFLGTAAREELRPEPLFDQAAWVTIGEALARVRFDTDRQVIEAAAVRLRAAETARAA